MKKQNFSFKKARFFFAAFSYEEIPNLTAETGRALPEIAIVGRSNVGKSTLINHLLNNKTLAKTSSTPGKTQSIVFFLIDESLALVDLPGYGYAKVSKELKKDWADLIDRYLTERSTLKLLLFLVDSRRELTKEDRAFLDWAERHKKQIVLIFTKCDKLKPEELKKLSASTLKEISPTTPFLFYSIKSNQARIDLIKKIQTLLAINGPHS